MGLEEALDSMPSQAVELLPDALVDRLEVVVDIFLREAIQRA